MEMFRKVVSLVLVFCVVLTMSPFVHAEEIASIPGDAFRVSDEYAAQYPNGVIEFATVQFETTEGASDFDVIVVRRGGTTGKVEVDFKIIEVTAKYGEDFVILVPSRYSDTALKKETDSPTLLESALEEDKDGFLTSQKYITEHPDFMNDLTDERTGDASQSEVTPIVMETTLSVEEPLEYTEVAPEYRSSLHQLRDEALGEITKAPDPIEAQRNIFDIEDPEYIKAGDALNTLMPGVTGHLVFQDGENYKTFKVRIYDDNLFEGPEQFIIGLCNPSNNAVLGDAFNATCNITDNDTGVGQVIGFEQETYDVSLAENRAVVNITRTGDIYTYSKIEISTLSGTAKADEHYAPVVTDTIFLPGETSKRVIVPLLVENVADILSFDIVLTQDGKPLEGINRATVNLIPEEARNDTSLLSVQSDFTLQSTGSQSTYVYIPGKDFAFESSYYRDYQGRTYGGNSSTLWETEGRQIVMEESRWSPLGYSSMYKWVDLRGISGITVTWRNTGTSYYNHSSIEINGNYCYRLDGSFNGDSYLGAANNLPRNQTIFRVINDTSGCYGNLGIWSLKLHKQQFEVVVEDAPTLVYNTWDGQSLRPSKPFAPGTVTPSNKKPYRDETITLKPNIYQEGITRGVKYVGYQIKTLYGYSNTYYSDTITLTPDFAEKNIYGNGTTFRQEKLIIRPVFTRTETSLRIKDYDDTKGELRIAGVKYKSLSFDTSFLLSGDVITGELIPAKSHSVVGYREYLKDADGDTTSDLHSIPVNIVLADKKLDQQIEPVFKETIKTVTIEWKPLGITFFETREENITKGMIFHDHRDNMPENERKTLYKNEPEVATPQFDNFENFDDYKEAMEEYRANLAQKEDIIKQNYIKYRQDYDVYQLEKLPVGEVVTLYAEPVENYTIAWWVEETRGDGNRDHTTDVVHIGSNFSFEVTENPQKVCYCFVQMNRPGNAILTGKVVQSKSTIKKQKAGPVNFLDPETYKGVPRVTVSVAVADSKNTSIIVDGKKYETTAITSDDGSFSIYVPYGVNNFYYSIKLVRGNIVETKSVTISNPMNIEIPFMDNFKIDSMDISVDNVIQDKIMIDDKSADITMRTVSYDNRGISKVRLRSYDSAGYIWQTLDAEFLGSNQWLVRTNIKETFKFNGRLTVEIYDDRGIGHGEIESGYKIDEAPSPGDVNLGIIPSLGPGYNLNPIGEINPKTDLGRTRSLIPVQKSPDSQTFSIAVGVGELLKQIVTDNTQKFDSKKLTEKAQILSKYLDDNRYSSNLLNKSWNNSKGSNKSGPGKGGVTVDFDVGFYIQLTRKSDGMRHDFYFDYAMIYVGCKVEAKQDINASICGIPVYITVRGGGKVRGLMMAEGGDDTRLLSTYGFFPLPDNYIGVEYFGMFHFNLEFALGAGIGYRGPASIGVEGVMDFDIVYQPWEDGYGTLTFSLNVDIDILMIPMKFNIAKSQHQLFLSDNYVDNDWLPLVSNVKAMMFAANQEGTTRIETLDRANASAWNTLPDGGNAGIREVETTTLQTGMYKHPQPKLISLNNNKKILFFINDDVRRAGYDRTALYYSVYDGVWNPPVMIQDDGKADYDPYATIIGDKLLVTWSSSNVQFGDTQPSMADLLNSTDIYAQFFNLEGEQTGEAVRITFDNGAYGNMTPEAVYDQDTGTVMLLYNKTDYKTDGVTFDGNALGIGDYLHNSYSTIAYRLFINGEWTTAYESHETSYINVEQTSGIGSLCGQRFLDFSMGDINPKVTEIAASSQDGKACIAYTLDVDNNPHTKDDTEIFLTVYDFAEKTFTSPVRITNNQVEDSNPQVLNDYLFWNHDGFISYVNLYTLMERIPSAFSTEDEESFLTVLNEKNTEAAESFTVATGEDGNMYVVWSEIGQSEVCNSENATIKERQLYATMYDAKYSQTGSDENGQPLYMGGWGDKQKITEKIGEYNNEQTVAVDVQGIITVVNRRYEIVDDTSTLESDKKETDTSSLVVRRFEPKTTLLIKASDITTYPEFPKANDNVMLTVDAVNEGFKPSEKATFRFEMYEQDQGWVQYCEDTVAYNRLASGGIISAKTFFTVPDDFSDEKPVKLKVTAWEEDMEDTSAVEYITITPKENLVIENQNGYLLNDGRIRITGNLLNSGGKSSENVTVTIEKFDDESWTDRMVLGDSVLPKPDIKKTYTYERVENSNIYPIDEIIEVSESDFGKDDSIEFVMNVKKIINNLETTLHSKSVVVSKKTPLDTCISDIEINNNLPVSLKTGTSKNIDARIQPYGAVNVYKLQYTSLNPDIAVIDPVNGFITGVKKGTAEILVEAVKFKNAYFCDLNNRLFDSNGNLVELNEDGSIKNIVDIEPDDIVMASKNIFIAVTDSQSDPEEEPDPDPSKDQLEYTSGVMRTKKEGTSVTLQLTKNSALMLNDVFGTINRLKDEIQGMNSFKIEIDNDELTMGTAALKVLEEKGLDVILSLKGVDVELSRDLLDQIMLHGGTNITISAVKTESTDGRPVIDVKLTCDNRTITEFNGQELTITIPYILKDGEDENAIVIYYINDNDECFVIPNGQYKDGFVTFSINHLSKFEIGYNKVTLSDGSGWAEEYITCLVARGVVNGTGDGMFKPQSNVTRAEFVKMLAKLSGDQIPEQIQSRFADVVKTDWFAPYVAWAFENGFVLGKSDTKFAPKDYITREQMAVIVERFLKAKKYKFNVQAYKASFEDDADVSAYAKEAVRLLSGMNIISGKGDNKFDPKGYATRAESAKVLALLIGAGR